MGIYQEEYIKKKKEQVKMLDISAYYNGIYVQNAIASCFIKSAKYPDKPLSESSSNSVKALEDMTEEEQEEEFYRQFRNGINKMNESIRG